MTFVRVALDVPVDTLFDYRAGGADAIGIGSLVLVPFGRRIVVGVVLETTAASSVPTTRLRSVLSLLPDVPPVPADVLSLLRFCSHYYHHPIGEVVLNALPTRLRRRGARKQIAHARYRLTSAGRSLGAENLPARAGIQRALYEILAPAADGVDADRLHRQIAGAPAALRAMMRRGWIELLSANASIPTNVAARTLPGPRLTAAQQHAVDEILQSSGRFAAWLLHGVTGSGKTEVYLQLIGATLAQGKQALLLVPEINLTPQLETRIQSRFPDTPIVRLNSALSESERLRNWLAAGSGAAGIVLGTRLAVFTPLPRLGLIVVDEEHDASFKQADGLRYSARDIALLRAKNMGVPVVLGSATPSLETYHQALQGRYRMLTLTQRPHAAAPAIETVDIRGEALIDGLAQTTLRAIQEAMRRGEQSLVYVNRRGYAPVLMCPACRWTAGCLRCSAKLVVHLKARLMRCHHCGHQEKVPLACPHCGNAELAPLGQGTQRVETALARTFPAARILRVDRDSTRAKEAWNQMRRQIHDGAVDLLVGTQMLAKGHDFPALTLVCVINADASLYSVDYRAGERLFANLMQVSGRAGRAELPGRVLIQTEFPDHPLYAALRNQNFDAFAQTVLAERKQAGLPPYTYQAILRAEALRQDAALDFLRLAAACADRRQAAVTVYDPVPAGMARLAGKERAQLAVQSRSRTALQAFLRDWAPRLASLEARRVRWALDIDPQES
jgi:primosomal protein N' (replication factor Y)